MDEKSMDTRNSRVEDERRTEAEEDEEIFVFEGITLTHSPRLGRRLIRWLSERRS